MPQLVKGGKWVFGWVLVGPDRQIKIPPAAFKEFKFQPGEAIIFTRGSRSSGGCGVGRREFINSNEVMPLRGFADGVMGESSQIVLPEALDVEPGERLLVVRGSRYALGLLKFGLIVEEARRHPELEVFAP